MSGNLLPTHNAQPKSMHDKVTALKNFAISYEAKLRGGVYDASTGKFKYINKALVGNDFINKTTGMINTFAEEANLFTTKDREKFILEFADLFYRVNVFCLNDPTLPADNYRSVIKIAKDTVSNLGDIFLGSKDSIKGIFEKYETPETSEEEF